MKKIIASKTADQYWVKEHNLSILLERVWNARSPISRPELRDQSSLNKMTVSNLIAELEKWNFVQVTGTYQPSNSGRPGSLYEINPNGGNIIGIEIGINYINAVLANFRGEIIWRYPNKVEIDPTKIFAQAEGILQKTIKQANTYPAPILGVGIAVAALVTIEGTILLYPDS